jgi:hypothetical protein
VPIQQLFRGLRVLRFQRKGVLERVAGVRRRLPS